MLKPPTRQWVETHLSTWTIWVPTNEPKVCEWMTNQAVYDVAWSEVCGICVDWCWWMMPYDALTFRLRWQLFLTCFRCNGKSSTIFPSTSFSSKTFRHAWLPEGNNIYPLVMSNIAIEHGPVEIVDLPMKNCAFPSLNVNVDQAGSLYHGGETICVGPAPGQWTRDFDGPSRWFRETLRPLVPGSWRLRDGFGFWVGTPKSMAGGCWLPRMNRNDGFKHPSSYHMILW